MVFGGVFAAFCRRGKKAVAPEREISLWRKNKKRAVGDAGPYEIQKRGRGGPTAGGVEPRPYADVRNFIVSAARRAAPTLAASGGKCAI